MSVAPLALYSPCCFCLHPGVAVDVFACLLPVSRHCILFAFCLLLSACSHRCHGCSRLCSSRIPLARERRGIASTVISHIGQDKSKPERSSSKHALVPTNRNPERLLLGSPGISSNTCVCCCVNRHQSLRSTSSEAIDIIIQRGVVPSESHPRAFVARKSGHSKQHVCLLLRQPS